MLAPNKMTTVVVAVLLTAGLVGVAGALVSDARVEDKTATGEVYRDVLIANATLTAGVIDRASIRDSHLTSFDIEDAAIHRSYISHASLDRVHVTDSRLENVGYRHATLDDVTDCNSGCKLVSGAASSRNQEIHARLTADAPATVSPGGTYDLRVEDAKASGLTIRNDPAGVTALGFDPRAADATIASLELWVEGEMVAAFAMGERVTLPDDDFTVRVSVADTGVVDGSTLGLVLDLDGRGLRPAITTVDVVATSLAFAPLEGQAFAPFLADNVARLVISVATDDNGNVDRDLDIAYTVNVLEVDDLEDARVVGDLQHHAFLHGDSELFSAEPIKYSNPTSLAAHHPATLELILRDTVGLEGITFGAAPFYATHLVAQSPVATSVELTAETTTSAGERLEAGPYRVDLGPLPEEPRSAKTPFGPAGDPEFPGEGTLRVQLVDGDGNKVDAEDGWVLMVQETPESHQVEIHVALDGQGSSFEMPIAASPMVGLPFGDFVPHEYLVCVHHDGETSCANDGKLVAIENGGTTRVEIDVS
ncbi:MAG TPA: hypothetical protein VM582_05415 [Candidatus Thermoplasmatota archaeon]|nr:hypothetical protein [Candidatus Thermoplasmatota archaeon]